MFFHSLVTWLDMSWMTEFDSNTDFSLGHPSPSDLILDLLSHLYRVLRSLSARVKLLEHEPGHFRLGSMPYWVELQLYTFVDWWLNSPQSYPVEIKYSKGKIWSFPSASTEHRAMLGEWRHSFTPLPLCSQGKGPW